MADTDDLASLTHDELSHATIEARAKCEAADAAYYALLPADGNLKIGDYDVPALADVVKDEGDMADAWRHLAALYAEALRRRG
jgi:hypothetical protein